MSWEFDNVSQRHDKNIQSTGAGVGAGAEVFLLAVDDEVAGAIDDTNHTGHTTGLPGAISICQQDTVRQAGHHPIYWFTYYTCRIFRCLFLF